MAWCLVKHRDNITYYLLYIFIVWYLVKHRITLLHTHTHTHTHVSTYITLIHRFKENMQILISSKR